MRWARAFALLAGIFFGAKTVHAEPTNVVELSIASGGDAIDAIEAERIDASVRELLGRLAVIVASSGTTSVTKPVARAAITLLDTREAEIVVTAANGGVLLMRRSRAPTATILREQVAHEVQIAVEAALLSPPPPPSAESAPPPSPPPPPAPPPSAEPAPAAASASARAPARARSYAFEVGTFAGGSLFARSQAAARVGAEVTLASRRGRRPSVTLAGAYLLPFETEADLVASRASAAMLRLVPTLQIYGGRSVAVDLGVGGGIDILTVAPRTAVLPRGALLGATTIADPVISAAATVHVAIVSAVVLDLSAGADIAPIGHRWVLARGREEEDIFVPFRLRPGVSVGISFAALGERRFAGDAHERSVARR